MTLQLSDARSELAAQLGLNQTKSSTKTLLDRWLNFAYQDIAGAYPWSWIENTDRVAMEVDLTTGTVDATAGSTTITFSSAPTASQVNRYIQFSSANDWYKITAHTAASATATIDPAYVQSSNLSAGTFTIRTFFYSLASTVESAYSAKQAISNVPISIITAHTYDRNLAFPEDTGDPKVIYMWGRDSSEQWQFSPFPWPSSAMIIEFKTITTVTDLSNDTDKPLFPTRFNTVWLRGAKAYGYEFLDDDRSTRAFNRFEDRIDEMKKLDNVGLTRNYILEAVDEGRNDLRSTIPFPAAFGPIHD